MRVRRWVLGIVLSLSALALLSFGVWMGLRGDPAALALGIGLSIAAAIVSSSVRLWATAEELAAVGFLGFGGRFEKVALLVTVVVGYLFLTFDDWDAALLLPGGMICAVLGFRILRSLARGEAPE